MGDYYYNNQNNPSMAKNYGYGQYQQEQRSFNSNTRSAQGRGYSANTNMPSYNFQASHNQTHYSGVRQTQSYDSFEQNKDDKPPPSYEDSQKDKLLRTSKRNEWNSQARDKMQNEQNTLKKSLTSIFDFPGQSEMVSKSPDWSSDIHQFSASYQQNPEGTVNNNSSQSYPQNLRGTASNDFSRSHKQNLQGSASNNSSRSYQQNLQERVNPSSSSSQQSWSAFSSGDRDNSNHRSLQNNQRRFTEPDQKWVRGEGGFRGHGNWQNRERAKDLSCDFNHMEEKESTYQGVKHELAAFDGMEDLDRDVNSEMGGGYANSEEQGHYSDNEGNYPMYENDRDYGALKKGDLYIPDSTLVTKYEFYPPSPEEMGEFFKDLVIHFFFKNAKNKNKKEQNPFVVICEAFRRSLRYSNLDVEDGYDIGYKNRKFCTLRYHGIMMARGVGENNNLKEPRVLAAVELINKLAMSCYTLESKPEYFSNKGLLEMKNIGSLPGVYFIVPKALTPDLKSAQEYLQLKFSEDEDSDTEYIFNLKEAQLLKNWAVRDAQYDGRMIIDDKWVGICRHRTPQYWRDKILASGFMENEKYILKPPQGIGNLLLKNDIKNLVKNLIFHLRTLPIPQGCKLTNVYGPPGLGPKISKALPPWDRRRGPGKSYRKKERKIAEQLSRGKPIQQARGYKYLSKKQKQKIKKRFGQC